MAQYQVTTDSKLLHQLFLSDANVPGFKNYLESILNQILHVQTSEQWSVRATATEINLIR